MQLAPIEEKADLMIRSVWTSSGGRQIPGNDFNSLLLLACHTADITAAFLTTAGAIVSSAIWGQAPAENQCLFSLVFPLRTSEGLLRGQLIIVDITPKLLTDQQKISLRLIADSLTQTIVLKTRLDRYKGDDSDRKSVTEELDRQKAFYENILNKLPTDIAVFDADHRYLFVNPGAISKEEYRKFIIGKDDYEYAVYRNRDIAVAHSRRAKFLEVKQSGKEIRWEDTLKDPQGNNITHLRRLFPVYDENGELNLVIGFGIDITERKIMEEKQTALVQQLSSRNSQLIDFCSIVSHNLRAPLVNMSMLVNFISENTDPVEQRLLISKLRPVIDNLHDTFNELVESIQIRQDLEIKSEDVCLSDCIRRTMEGLQPEISRLNARIETELQGSGIIHYPPQYLNSIIHNLISNSLKYHFPGRSPLIVVKTECLAEKIILSVRDNGLGIDLVKHRDNFFKIGKVFHRHPNAKGFGLYMTKTQVEAMGGRIWVESVPNEGSIFFIEFVNRSKQAS